MKRLNISGHRQAHRAVSSVSSTEVGKFSALSKTWWDPRENPLIGMNGIRMQYIQDQLKEKTNSDVATCNPPLTGLKALDVGCGGGLLSESLARLGAQVTAVDPSEDLVEAARWHSRMDPRTQSIDYRRGSSVEDLAAEIGSTEDQYDVICLLEVVEHVTDPDSILSAIRMLLKPDGKLFLSTLNRTTKSKVVAIWGAEYVMRYLPVGTHDWNQFRSPGEVEEIMQRNGLFQSHVTGMVLNKPPFFGKWDWRLDGKDVSINWIGTYQRLVEQDTQSTG